MPRRERDGVRRQDLSRPLIYSGDAGGGEFTVLTGGNVALAPAFVARVADGGPWKDVRRVREGLEMLAFARPPSHGLAGVFGRIAATDAGHAMALEGCFGSPAGLAELGVAMGAYLGDGDRFPVVPGLILAEGGPGLEAFAAALAERGIEPCPPASGMGR